MATTDDTKKMLKAIMNGQSAMKSELLTKIDKLDKKVYRLASEMKAEFKKTNARIDKIGKQVAYLEDDAPTREEFDSLQTKVDRYLIQ